VLGMGELQIPKPTHLMLKFLSFIGTWGLYSIHTLIESFTTINFAKALATLLQELGTIKGIKSL
jgi:hypothetical protein